MANGSNDARRGQLPPLAQVVELDFAPILGSVGELEAAFDRIAVSTESIVVNIRNLNTELQTTVRLAGGISIATPSGGGGAQSVESREQTKHLGQEIGREVGREIGSTVGHGDTGARVGGGLLPSFGTFPSLGLLSYGTAAQLAFQIGLWPHIRRELDSQSGGRFSPAWQEAGDILTGSLGIRPDLLQSSIRLDALRSGAAIGQFAVPAYLGYRGIGRLARDLRGAGTLALLSGGGSIDQTLERWGPSTAGLRNLLVDRVAGGAIDLEADLRNDSAALRRQAARGALGGFGRAALGFTAGQFLGGPAGALIGGIAGFTSSDLVTAPHHQLHYN